jgi:hypothetical protein
LIDGVRNLCSSKEWQKPEQDEDRFAMLHKNIHRITNACRGVTVILPAR